MEEVMESSLQGLFFALSCESGHILNEHDLQEDFKGLKREMVLSSLGWVQR
jgi:hypothetical protein